MASRSLKVALTCAAIQHGDRTILLVELAIIPQCAGVLGLRQLEDFSSAVFNDKGLD